MSIVTFYKIGGNSMGSGALVEDKSMEDKSTLEDISDVCTFNDKPRAKKLKEDIDLLRKKTKENSHKIKSIQDSIRRLLCKQQRKIQLKAFPFLKDHSKKRRRTSDDDDDDQESSESDSSPTPSEHIPMIDFDTKEHGDVEYELMEYANIEAGLSTGSPDIGLEAVLEDIMAEPEDDPLILIGKPNG